MNFRDWAVKSAYWCVRCVLGLMLALGFVLTVDSFMPKSHGSYPAFGELFLGLVLLTTSGLSLIIQWRSMSPKVIAGAILLSVAAVVVYLTTADIPLDHRAEMQIKQSIGVGATVLEGAVASLTNLDHVKSIAATTTNDLDAMNAILRDAFGRSVTNMGGHITNEHGGRLSADL